MKRRLARLMVMACLALPLMSCGLMSTGEMSRLMPLGLMQSLGLCTSIGEAFRMDDSGNSPSFRSMFVLNAVKGATPGGPVVWLYEYVSYVTWYAAQGLYEGIILNPSFRGIVVKFTALAIMFFGVGIMLGLISTPSYDMIMLVIKVSFIFALISNWSVFQTFVFEPLEGVRDANGAVQSDGVVTFLVKKSAYIFGGPQYYDKNNHHYSMDMASATPIVDVLRPMDNLALMMAGPSFWQLVGAVWMAGLQGKLYAILLTFMAITYLFAMIRAAQTFLMAMLARCLLYSVAPLFFICLLFRTTRGMFSAWTEQVLSNCLQPIFLFIWLGAIHNYILGFVEAIPDNPDVSICYAKFMDFPFISWLPGMNWWLLTDGKTQLEPRGPFGDIPLHLWYIVGTMCISYILFQMTDWTVAIAAKAAATSVNLAGTYGLGWNTVNAATDIPVGMAVGTARGAVLGVVDSDGVKRRGGLTGLVSDSFSGRGFHPLHHMSAALSGGRQGLRQGVDETVKVLRRDLGITDD